MSIEIWMGGSRSAEEPINSECVNPRLLGVYETINFDTAVDLHLEYHPEDAIAYRFGGITKTHTIWGCKLYDNETQARSFFG